MENPGHSLCARDSVAGYPLSILIRFILIRAEDVKFFHYQMRRVAASLGVHLAIDKFGVCRAFYAHDRPSG